MILTILEKLISISGTNDRIAELAKHKNNEVLKTVLFLSHDPNTTFGMKTTIPTPLVDASQPTEQPIEYAFSTIHALAARQVTGDAAKRAVATCLGSLTANDRIVMERILKQDLKIAMGIKNINKAIGKDFLQETPYMRCSLVTPETLSKFKWVLPDGSPGVYSEVKMDGQYLNHKVLNLVYSAESRNGKPYDFLGVMDSEFAALATILKEDNNIIDPVFNGEAVVSDGNGGVLPRTTGNGIIQKFGKDTGTLLDAENVLAVLWDVVPLANYKSGSWNKTRKERREIMIAALTKLNKSRQDQRDAINNNPLLTDAEKAIKLRDVPIDRVRMVEFKPVLNFAEAWAYNTEVMARGDEGTIIKDERGPWKSHTSPWQLKLKLKMSIDLRVVDFEEGASGKKFDGSLGAVIVESACKQLRCKVGTGFKELFCPKKDIGTDKEYSDDKVRQYIWDNKEQFRNMVMEVEANDIVQDRNSDILKLFLPVFSEWRYDKDTYDDVERIREIKQSTIMAMFGDTK